MLNEHLTAFVRLAEERDAEAASEVLRRSITECCFEDHRGDARLLDAWLADKTPENMRQWIADTSYHAVVAEAGGAVVGVGVMTSSGDVTLLYLLPEARFLGVGKALLTELESRGRDLGLDALRLNSTKAARQFYRKHGFESAGPPRECSGVLCHPMIRSYR